MKKDKISPVRQLLSLVWGQSLKATGHSWERLNHSMYAAMQLAINAGMPFEADDFSAAMNEFRAGYWFGETGGESLYTLAVQTGNLSAAQAYEAWKGRPPFIVDDVDPGWNRSFAHTTGKRARGRVAVGFSFPWQGHDVTVTSFSDDGRYLTACAYTKGDRRKVTRRFKITIAGIRADRRLRKERDDLYKRLRKLSLGDGKIIETFRERSGITSNEAWRTAPLEDIRTHVEALEQEHAQAA